MKELFGNVLGIEGVKGCMLISFKGEILFEQFKTQIPGDPSDKNWKEFVDTLDNIREVDLVFSNDRMYIRKAEIGYLMVFMSNFAPVAMLRLNCDILLPSLQPKKAKKGLTGLFKK